MHIGRLSPESKEDLRKYRDALKLIIEATLLETEILALGGKLTEVQADLIPDLQEEANRIEKEGIKDSMMINFMLEDATELVEELKKVKEALNESC